MNSASLDKAGLANFGERLTACVGTQGTSAHPYSLSDSLLSGPYSGRNLCDTVHLLCTLHGRYPGVIDHASFRCFDSVTKEWFKEAVEAFAVERALLTRLAVVAGPVPGTPGSSGTEAAVIGQRHALGMLAQSERRGCALGAALALAMDWVAVRAVIDVAATRFGVDAPPFDLERSAPFASIAEAAADGPAVERAILFGAEQIAIQHFGLWDLLEVRQQARVS